ncbi:hypothetical protein [Thermus thermamylovorans]|uniref:CPBP family intramembrane metalloprotease n=1 Tax=Thermus thermamylovorans TaxID=2509362 RepID=A0A4Q9B1N4_9DEIN|nr:hypothetical protein [Thermus thermamylovorans]TBH17514.1 hypothetical protein ETP66_09010 [Thermus thermamylovorans]
MRGWLALVLAFGLSALAAPLATLYDGLEEALRQVRPEDPSRTLAALDRAQGVLRQGEGLPPVIRDAALANLQEARQAALRRSSADLEARLFLVRHLVGKALYDGYLQAQGAEGEALLARLARATDLPQEAVAEVRGLPPEEARRRLEARYLQLLAQDLNRTLGAASRPEAYLALARAYARYLVVQDSPQSPLRAQEFVRALARISAGEEFRPEVRELRERVLAWRTALLQAPGVPAPPAPRAQAPTPAPPTVTPRTPPPGAPPSGPEAEALLTPALREEIGFLPLPEEVALELGLALQRLAIPSVVDWLGVVNEVRSSLAIALLHVQSGDPAWARTQLRYAHEQYRLLIQPVARTYAPELAERADRLFLRTEGALGLRTVDLAVLLGEMQEIEERLFGNTQGLWHALQVQVQLLTLGLPRAVFFLLAAALAFFPLYLIRLTFGGRNVYWNLLGLAFLFLVLPILAEGLSYLGSVLAEHGGLPLLAALANLSIAQALVPYLAWGLTVFLVVALAGAGLRGIAAQFGLLKERGAEVAAGGWEERASTGLTSETIVEWDEEF